MSRISVVSAARAYSAAEVREFDRVAIEAHGIPGIVLMKRAGAALWRYVRERFGPRSLVIACGKGNNAGDGYVVARLAADAGVRVRVVELADPPPDSANDAGAEARRWAHAGSATFETLADASLDGDVIIDALLGTGLSGSVRPRYAEAIERINASGVPVVAADLPSGLSADTGAVLGQAIRADATVSFIALKRGLFTGAGPEFAGEVVLDDLEVPEGVVDPAGGVALLRLGHSVAVPRRRRRDAHKNRFGHVLIIGGDTGMGGAAILAAEAALRTGAGLVSVATRAAHVAPLLARCPSAMVRPVEAAEDLGPLLERAGAVVVGPGIGRAAWGRGLLEAALAWRGPRVIDADALNLLPELDARLDAATLITPHPGEAARLLGVSNAAVQADRFAASANLVERLGAQVILKGAGTLVSGPAEETGIVLHGNPGMATAGMGDVLSGVCGALAAQYPDAHRAACVAACLHSAAADLVAAEHGEIGLNAHDVPAAVRRVVNGATPP